MDCDNPMNRAFLLFSWLVATTLFGETRVLSNFTLIDGTGRDAAPNSAMIITDGRITWVGPLTALKKPQGAQTVDLTGKFVMPGIMNMHGHLGNVIDFVQDPKNFTRENAVKQLKQYARYGVTSMVSMGSDQPPVFDIRKEQRAGRPHEARVFTAYKGFTGVGGYPTTAAGMKGVPFEVSTNAQIDQDVKQLADMKVDLVKVWVDDHLGKDKKIPLDLVKHIIADAHQYHLKAAAHIFYLEDARTLVNSGLDAMAHSVRDKPVDDALIAAMKRTGTYQIPTLSREASMFVYGSYSKMLDDPLYAQAVSPAMLKTLKTAEYQKKSASDPDFKEYPQFLKTAQANLKKLHDAGVKIAFGTDTGVPLRIPGYFEHWEMQLMAEAGIPARDIIMSASKNAAEFLGVEKDLGTLEKGKWADLVVLTRNPLADIRNSRAIESVMIAGNTIER
jgi:imidazolonepropionase-like amidohydrolase